MSDPSTASMTDIRPDGWQRADAGELPGYGRFTSGDGFSITVHTGETDAGAFALVQLWEGAQDRTQTFDYGDKISFSRTEPGRAPAIAADMAEGRHVLAGCDTAEVLQE